MGIQCFANQDSGACLLKFSRDGKVLDFVAISEERLLRKKYPYTFPVHSIGYCMDHYGLKDLSSIDLLVTDYIRIKRWFNSGPGYSISDFDYLKLKFDIDPRKIVTISHHMAHAASVYYTSGFDDAAVLIVDGNGSDLQTTSFFEADNGKIRYIDEYKAHGIGAVYNVVTKWILNLGTGGEGKTMGLAPFGEPHEPVLHLNGKLDGIKNDFSDFVRRQPFSDVLNQIDPANRVSPLKKEYRQAENEKALLKPYFSRVAFDVQKETEQVLVHLGREIERRTGRKKICLAGGVALNSVANKIMFDATGFEEIFVFPACSDSGIPFGLAVWGYYNARELGDFERKNLTFRNAYTGISYPDERTTKMFERHDIPNRKTTPREVAQLIADGNIIGWFQGGSEYGPRALGHRSILADARQAEMKDILNLRIKHREAFRPFAPAVLAEDCAEYFDIEGDSPYMLLVGKVKKPEAVPSITHIDGTARVQTVTQEDNGVYYDLVHAFKEITGVPVILNTSFNDAGEPIVETPEDAMICFLRTGMDYLVLGDFLIDAKDVDKAAVSEHMAGIRETEIEDRYNDCLSRFFPGYDEDECRRYIEESNRISEWHVRYRSKYEFENKVLEWIRDKRRILIVGTADHTALLAKYINRFYDVDVVGFVNGDDRCDQEGASQDHPYPECGWDVLESDDVDEILVSSYEYMYDISDSVRQRGIDKPVYSIYDNASRSFFETMDVFPPFRVK
jgi:carbamoyltransferase